VPAYSVRRMGQWAPMPWHNGQSKSGTAPVIAQDNDPETED